MFKGGYKIIDFKGIDFTTKTKLPNIYESIEGNYGKALLLSGVHDGTSVKNDFYADFSLSGTSFVFNFNATDGTSMTITVEDDDNVTIAEAD